MPVAAIRRRRGLSFDTIAPAWTGAKTTSIKEKHDGEEKLCNI
jgi:hypothetical protein